MPQTTSKSFERLSLAALAVLTLAPVCFQAGWPWLSLTFGATGDAFRLTLAALVVTGGAVIAYWLSNQRSLLSAILVSALIGVGLAVSLGQDVPSKSSVALGLLGVAVVGSLALHWLVTHLPADLDSLTKPHLVKTALFMVVAVYTIGQTARLSTFMGDAKRAEQSVLADIIFFVDHSCLTAYVHALKLAQAGVDNLYDVAHWPNELEIGEARATTIPQIGPYAPFYLDGYMYPPQFLLLPAVLLGGSDNFLAQRGLWFGFSALWLAMGVSLVAYWVSEKGHRRALWLTPLLWSTVIVLVTLQVGNVHHVVVVMAVLAMVAFERKQPILGGALLAFAIVSKISPIFLGVVLLVQRRWREAAWTFAFGLLFTMLSVLVFGLRPLQSFLIYELPRLSSGEAMQWAFNDLANISVNTAPFSIPFKLSALGVPFENVFGVARMVNTLYTLLLLGVTVFFALPHRTRSQKLDLWLGVLTLSALQSPFAPTYVIMPVFWILTLRAAEVENAAGVIAIGLVWVILMIPATITDTSGIVIGLFQQSVIFGVLIFALWPRPAPLADMG